MELEAAAALNDYRLAPKGAVRRAAIQRDARGGGAAARASLRADRKKASHRNKLRVQREVRRRAKHEAGARVDGEGAEDARGRAVEQDGLT